MTQGSDAASRKTDPTLLTTEQLIRGLNDQERYFGALIDGLAQSLKHAQVLETERFNRVWTIFEEREKQTAQAANQNAIALAAAFKASADAVAAQNVANSAAAEKSERNITDQIRGQGELFRTFSGAQTTAINDLKEQVASMAAAKQGQTTSNRDTLAIVAVGISLSVLLLDVLGRFLTR